MSSQERSATLVPKEQLVAVIQDAAAGFLCGESMVVAEVGQQEGEQWTGCITVAGSWHGAICVACTPDVARKLAARIFGDDAGDDDELLEDALAELTNVVGGNVKSLVSSYVGGTSRLWLPLVTHGKIHFPSAMRQQKLRIVCEHGIFDVSLVEIPGTDAGTRKSDSASAVRVAIR